MHVLPLGARERMQQVAQIPSQALHMVLQAPPGVTTEHRWVLPQTQTKINEKPILSLETHVPQSQFQHCQE